MIVYVLYSEGYGNGDRCTEPDAVVLTEAEKDAWMVQPTVAQYVQCYKEFEIDIPEDIA